MAQRQKLTEQVGAVVALVLKKSAYRGPIELGEEKYVLVYMTARVAEEVFFQDKHEFKMRDDNGNMCDLATIVGEVSNEQCAFIRATDEQGQNALSKLFFPSVEARRKLAFNEVTQYPIYQKPFNDMKWLETTDKKVAA